VDEVKELRNGFKRRLKENILKKSKKFNVAPPNEKALWAKVLRVYRNGFYCEYCGRKMKVKGDGPYDVAAWSIDHRRSLWNGGDNSIDNIAIVCHGCNIVKGTMSEETFREIVELIKKHKPELLDRWYREVMAGRLANKLEREEALKG